MPRNKLTASPSEIDQLQNLQTLHRTHSCPASAPGTSARDAIRWTNWDIDPETFALET